MLNHQQIFAQEAAPETPWFLKNNVTSISKGKDNGAMESFSKILWKPLGHSNTKELVENLQMPRWEIFGDKPETGPYTSGLSPKRYVIICGHGSSGYIETGNGQMGFNLEAEISNRTLDIWRHHLVKIGFTAMPYTIGNICLLGCSVGAGIQGAELMFHVANVTNMAVLARTGLVTIMTYGNQRWIEFERGSDWKVVLPSSTMPEPSYVSALPKSLISNKQMKTTSNPSLNWLEVETVKFEIIDNGKVIRKEFSKEVAEFLEDNLFYSEPYSSQGQLLGQITMQIFIRFRNQTSVHFIIYSDRVAQTVGTNTYILVSPNFREFITRL